MSRYDYLNYSNISFVGVATQEEFITIIQNRSFGNDFVCDTGYGAGEKHTCTFMYYNCLKHLSACVLFFYQVSILRASMEVTSDTLSDYLLI